MPGKINMKIDESPPSTEITTPMSGRRTAKARDAPNQTNVITTRGRRSGGSVTSSGMCRISVQRLRRLDLLRKVKLYEFSVNKNHCCQPSVKITETP